MPSKSSAFSKRVERVQNSVRQLPIAAAELNAATDQLGTSISELDSVLKRFALGVPTWVKFAEWSHPYGDAFSYEQIGYAKIGGKWGIAIRTVAGNESDSDSEEVQQWLFNDSPRLLRVQAIEKIPELLEALLKSAADMTQQISEKAAEVDALTAGIVSVIGPTASPQAAKR